jgi:DNA-binding Lrp family transcriptional regulator
MFYALGTKTCEEENDLEPISSKRELTALEKRIIHELQQDLPVTSRPFAEVADKVGISETQLLEKVREFLANGTIRRFGATLRHQRSGFEANAMVVWEVGPERTEEVGAIFASFREVSHCYQRPALPTWPYRIFTMIHGSSREVCQEIARKMADAAGIENYELLFTEEELKKTTMAYFGDD